MNNNINRKNGNNAEKQQSYFLVKEGEMANAFHQHLSNCPWPLVDNS